MMEARQRKRNIRNSRRQEQEAAKDIGGRVQTNSGALRLGGGGDVRLRGKIRIECKLTEKDFYVLKVKELLKLKKQAIEALEYPVFQFAFKKSVGSLKKFAAVPFYVPTTITNEIEEAFLFEYNTIAGQITLPEGFLDAHLLEDGCRIRFKTKDNIYHNYEILHWDTFLDRWESQQKEQNV